MIEVVKVGFIHHGDVFVCDNVAVHITANIQDFLLCVVEEWEVEIKFLPTYSPKLNLCELVFVLVKKLLHSKISYTDFLEQICLYFLHFFFFFFFFKNRLY